MRSDPLDHFWKATLTAGSSDQDGRGFGSSPSEANWPHLVRLLAPIVVTFFCLLIGASVARAAEYTVNSTGDQADEAPGSGGCKTPVATCTLRAAIEESNASTTEVEGVNDTIKFASFFNGQVGDVIDLGSPLPTITDQVNLEGNPRPQDCETDYFSFTGPCVGINGPAGGTAFRVAAKRVLLIGFAISGAKTAVEAVGAPGLEVWNNWFGLKLDGSADPLETGISIDQNSNGPLIGLSTGAANIFAHDTNAGLEINGADYATVSGNGFGVLPDGNSLAANGNDIEIADAESGQNRVARGNWIGGTFAYEDPTSTICDVWCNVISGATESGIDLSGDGPGQDPATGSTRIFANYIGLNAFGTFGVPNAQQAILVGAAENVTIGGSREIDRNLINGGVSTVLAQPHADNLAVENNWIGLNATGSKMLAPPSDSGIDVEGSYQVGIVGNRISMSGGTAIEEDESEVGVIRGNTIGEGTGGQELPGGSVGIRLQGFYGDWNLVEDNSIANVGEYGLQIENEKNEVFANRIEAAGVAGILIDEPPPYGFASSNVIGADSADQENTISGSGGAAIEIVQHKFNAVSRNLVGRNNGAMNGGRFVTLVGGANGGILPPAFSGSTQDGATGEGAEPGATIRVFRKADSSTGEIESFLAETTADKNGEWAVAYPSSIPGGTIIAANQTDAKKGTSEFAFATTATPEGGEENGGGNGGQPEGNPPEQAPDTTAPETTIIKGPKSSLRSRAARFQFISGEPSRFRCKLDERAVSSCQSPRVYHHLYVGKHVFEVWAVDAAGNEEASPAKWVFQVHSK
jgi:CSLREA domain-containing protein